METFHIEFTWPISVIKTMLDQINVKGLGEVNPKTRMYSSWPAREDWEALTSSIASKMITKPKEDEAQIIDNRLTAAEAKLNALLSSDAIKNEQVETLKTLITELEEIQSLIYLENSDEHYPFFARWFTLNVIVLTLFNQYETRVAQVRIVKLWYEASDYLQNVMHIASINRNQSIGQELTGEHLEKIFIKDNLHQKILTKSINFIDDKNSSISVIRDILANQIAQQHLRDIHFDKIITLLREGRNSLIVTKTSKTKQENVGTPMQFWTAFNLKIAKQTEQSKELVENTLNEMVLEEPQPVPLHQQLSQGRNSSISSRKIDKEELASDIINAIGEIISNPSDVQPIDVIQSTLSIGLGLIPGFGGILSTLSDTIFSFFGSSGSDRNPWKEFEEKMIDLIKNYMGEYDAGTITVKLNLLETYIQEYISLTSNVMPKGQYLSKGTTSQKDLDDFQNRLNTVVISNLRELKIIFNDPPSKSYFHTCPYYLRYFKNTLLLLSIAKTLKLNIDYDIEHLYDNGPVVYIPFVIDKLVAQCKGDVRATYNTKKNDKNFIKEHRLDNLLTGEIKIDFDDNNEKETWHHLERSAKSSAGIIAVTQLMKEPIIEIIKALENDSSMTNTIKNKYVEKIQKLHSEIYSEYSHAKHKVQSTKKNDDVSRIINLFQDTTYIRPSGTWKPFTITIKKDTNGLVDALSTISDNLNTLFSLSPNVNLSKTVFHFDKK